MVVRFRLENGLTVVHEPVHAANVVAFQVWVKTGSAEETPSEVGLAHLHEHMLFKGTTRRGPGEVARAVESRGGEINAWTSFDQTVYHTVSSSEFAFDAIEVLADAVRNATFDPDELQREIEVVCEEIKRSLDMPSRRASRLLFENAFPTHPFGRPVIGDEASVRAHTRAGVMAFFRRHYAPDNMVVAVAGDATEAQVRDWVDRLFKDAVPTGVVRPPRPPVARWAQQRTVLEHADVAEANVHIALQIPGATHPDAPALDVLASIAGFGETSRLAMELKRKKGLVNDVTASAWTPPLDEGLFTCSLSLASGDLRGAVAGAFEVLFGLVSNPIGQAELDVVKSMVEAQAVYQREVAQSLARKLGHHEAMLGGLEFEARYLEAIAQLTCADVERVAKKYLTLERCLVTGLIPRSMPLGAEDVTAALAAARSRPTTATPRVRRVPPPPERSARRAAAERLITLPSGARLILKEERHVPLVAMRAVALGGLRAETPANNGLSALWSRTATRGVGELDAEAVTQVMEEMSGSLSSMAGRNSMTLRMDVLSRHLGRALPLFLDAVQRPSFLEGEVERERKRLLQDQLARQDNSASVAFDACFGAMWSAHPYRLPPMGTRETVERLTRADLSAFHQCALAPQNLVFSCVGDFDLDEAVALFSARLASPSGVAKLPAVGEDPARTEPAHLHLKREKAQTHLVLGFRGARVSDDWRRALEVATTVLSGQSGRLFMELRDKASLAYSVSCSAVDAIERGYALAYIATSPEKVEAALAGMTRELRRLCEEPITEAERARAIENLCGGHAISLQRTGARAATFAIDECLGVGAYRSRDYTAEIRAVTVQMVQEAAAKVFDFSKVVTVQVGR